MLGALGVIIFFFISGILISHSALKNLATKEDYSIVDYLVERFARIYTALFPCIILVFALQMIRQFLLNGSFTIPRALGIEYVLVNLAMLQNLTGIGITNYGYNVVLWTLNLEWWLYIAFGAAIFALFYIKKKPVVSVLLGVVGVFVWIYLLVPLSVSVGIPVNNGLLYCWAAGAMITMLLLKTRIGVRGRFALLSLVPLLLVLIVWRILYLVKVPSVGIVYDITFEALLGGIILCLVLSSNGFNTIPSRVSKLVKGLADYSYTLYLVQFPILSFCFMFIPQVNFYVYLFILGLLFVMTNLFAYIIASCTERHHRQVAEYIKRLIRTAMLNNSKFAGYHSEFYRLR
jgi:Predicted acyltransferases